MEMIIGPVLFFTFAFIIIRHLIKVKRFNASVPEQFKIQPETCCKHNNEAYSKIYNPKYSYLAQNVYNR